MKKEFEVTKYLIYSYERQTGNRIQSELKLQKLMYFSQRESLCLTGHQLFDEEFEEELKYKIVGTAESNPLEGYISNESPVGAALLGKKLNDRVEVNTPNGKMYFIIKEIN